MTIALITAGAALIVCVGVIVVLLRRDRPIRYAQHVLVNLKTGNAVEGVLVSTRGNALTVAQASVLVDGRDPEAVDGAIVVARGNVDFVQRLSKAPE